MNSFREAHGRFRGFAGVKRPRWAGKNENVREIIFPFSVDGLDVLRCFD